MTERPLRVLLADDHSIVRRGLRTLLADAGVSVVGEASDGLEALRLCHDLTPDLLVVDVTMPGLNGIDVAARSQKLPKPPGIIILSVHSDESYIIRALSAGARAYLLKNTTDEDLVPAVQAVSTGKAFFSPAVASALVEDYVQTLRGVPDAFHLLTDREKEVLQLLAEGHSNRDVAGLLDLGLATVESYRANLMEKLDLHNTAEIVLYGVRKGIVTYERRGEGKTQT
jgi:DNA-binding NarL/FixJ family response regulator